MILPRVSAGEAITAAGHNRMAKAIEDASGRGGAGLTVRLGVVLPSERPREVTLDATIIEVHGGGIEPRMPADITYTARAIGRGAGPTLEAASQQIVNRPHTDHRGGNKVRVIPARVGDPCRIWRIPTETGGVRMMLEVLTEEIWIEGPCPEQP